MIRRIRWNRTSVFGAAATAALALAGAAVVAQTASTDDAKNNQDKEKIEKELKDLTDQRAKLDTRIRELRRHAGRDSVRTFTFSDGTGKSQVWTVPGPGAFYFGDGKFKELKELTPEQRKKVEEAMAEARRALEKVKGELPEGFVMPDIQGIVGDALRFRSLAPGNAYVTPRFDTKEFREQMQQMREDIRRSVEQNRALVAPRVYGGPQTSVVPRVYAVPRARVTPAIPPSPTLPMLRDSNPGLRDEIRELRRELEQLREELHKERGDKPGRDRKTQFLDPFGGTL